MDKVGFYSFSYNNPARKRKLEEQFKSENLPVEFIDPVENDDNRVKDAPQAQKRTWAIMFSHLDMLKKFIQSNNNYAVFLEDDLLLRRNLRTYLPELIAAFNRRHLDILLLSYLTTQKPAFFKAEPNFFSSETNLLYLEYDDNIWCAHMYLLDRRTATRFLEIYTTDYAKTTLIIPEMPAFSPDWTLTKIGRRALVYPMMGVEEGTVNTKDQAQVDFHRNCKNIHYDKNEFY